MRERHEEVKAPTSTTTASGIEGHGEDCSSCFCEDGYSGRQEYHDCARRADGLLMMVVRDDSTVDHDRREQVISLTPSLVITIEDSLSPTTSTLSIRSSSDARTSSSSSSSSSTGSPNSIRSSIASTPRQESSATTISTVTIIQPTHSLSPRTSLFTPTGYQSVVPTYPPTSSSSSASASTPNPSSLATKLGLGLGIPILVLLTLLLTSVLHRHQARLAKDHHNQRQKPPSPEMATISTTEPAYPRLHPVPSSRLSTAGDVVVTPAPGLSSTAAAAAATTPTPRTGTTRPPPVQLYFPPPPSPPPPAVPRRNSARLLAGPLTSHPPAVRPTSSIYGGEIAIRESAIALGGNGVGDVLAEYMDFHPRESLDGPLWNPDEVRVPALVLPPKPVARNRQQDQRRQYLFVDVDHSPGGIDEVSPLSSSSSGQHNAVRNSVMSGLSPSTPVRTHSGRRTCA